MGEIKYGLIAAATGAFTGTSMRLNEICAAYKSVTIIIRITLFGEI